MQITDKALEKIEELISTDDIVSEFAGQVPVIMWIENRTREDDLGPALGLVEEHKVRGSDCFTKGTTTVYNGLPEELQKKYEGAVLDFTGMNFELVVSPTLD